MSKIIGTEHLKPIVWMNPDVLPVKNNKYWVTIELDVFDEPRCHIAIFHDGYFYVDGTLEPINHIGKVLAWAEYSPPRFIEC